MKRTPQKKQKKNLKQLAFNRFMLVVAIFVLWIGAIGARLVHLQVKQHEWLKDRAESQRRDVKKSKLPRGTIYDRDGRVLAMSVVVKTLYADATELVDLPAAAKAIAMAANANENQILKTLKQGKSAGRKFVPLVKELSEETVQQINKRLETANIRKGDLPKFPGLHWKEEQKRSYPQNTLAAHVLGFSNSEGIGQAGIEKSQNDVLYGATVRKTQERDRLGRIYYETVSEKAPPRDVVLTISNSIQYKTEQALESAVKASGANAGIAIVMSNRTGEILAMANYPTFDPNRVFELKAEYATNRSVQSVYSPGSVFKLVTYGSALEQKLITPDGEIDSGNGTIEIAKHKFRDSHAIGKVSYSKAMAHSSNVCAIKTGMRVGKENFYSAVQKLGFGKPSGIALPAETGGIVRSPAKWNGDSLASMSIGYEIGVTALQMASAFATIANDGVKIQPRIIKEIRQSDTTIETPREPEKTQVFSAETARGLRGMLREVVLAGTGKRAQLNGYSSAGKTGTAWKFDEKLKRVNSAKYVSSFIGFAPAENPEVTIAVVMDEPKIGGRDGGQVSAPVFREIAEGILPELGVKPNLGFEIQTAVTDEVPETVGNGELNTDADGAEGISTEGGSERGIIKSDKKLIERTVASIVRKEKEVKRDSTNAKDSASPKKQTKNKSSTGEKERKT